MKANLFTATVPRAGFLFLLLSTLALVVRVPAQDALFTYQGKVTHDGTNFTGSGLFKFALVTSTSGSTATATASVTNGFVTGISVTYGGSGYFTAPAVSITGGGGSGATATANVSDGSVTSITVDSAGSNYTSAPTLTIAPPSSLSFTTWWSNDGTSTNGTQPSNAVSLAVSGGLFMVILGNTALPNMTAIPSALFINNTSLQLLIWFNDGVDGFAMLTPPQNLSPLPYAMNASSLSGSIVVEPNTNGAPEVIVNPSANYVFYGVGATISGGGATDYGGTDYTNSVAGDFATVGGGAGNISGNLIGVFADYLAGLGEGGTTVGGGEDNTATNYADTVSGGYDSMAYGPYATVAGGDDNFATNYAATVGGGEDNTAVGYASMVPGGYNNQAIGSGIEGFVGGDYLSFAAGANAQALFDGSFVWADDSAGTFVSYNNNSFSVRATGGMLLKANVGVGTGTGDYRELSMGGGNSTGFLFGYYPGLGDGIHLSYNTFYDSNWPTGGVVNAGGPTARASVGYGTISFWVSRATNSPPTTERVFVNSNSVTFYGTVNGTSDRNAKQNFAPVSPTQILDRVLELPISEWSYKDDASTRHIGPMGQDFYSLFNIGTDEKHIAPLDEEAVALAALQGLNQKVEEQRAQIADLQQKIEAFEKLVNNQAHN